MVSHNVTSSRPNSLKIRVKNVENTIISSPAKPPSPTTLLTSCLPALPVKHISSCHTSLIHPLTHLPTHPPTHSPSNMPPSRSGPHPHPNPSPSHPAILTPSLSTYQSHLITSQPSTSIIPPSPTNPLSTLTFLHPYQEECQHTRASE
ncbi:hypothetical protein Pmani_006126 [Petrolisthes manimaculis]|uniref:Uncharacterized protein n=1 Tax=Petrolisthes manimaculis TaxID=1843537 RepID=A0AAE1UG12_9EUCA|nr:hypothetical protein Pmani_006126 [Petrolisthes manimaculis]